MSAHVTCAFGWECTCTLLWLVATTTPCTVHNPSNHHLCSFPLHRAPHAHTCLPGQQVGGGAQVRQLPADQGGPRGEPDHLQRPAAHQPTHPHCLRGEPCPVVRYPQGEVPVGIARRGLSRLLRSPRHGRLWWDMPSSEGTPQHTWLLHLLLRFLLVDLRSLINCGCCLSIRLRNTCSQLLTAALHSLARGKLGLSQLRVELPQRLSRL